MTRRPWWEWDAAELKHSSKVPAGYSIDYYEKPHGNETWRKYLIEGKPCNLSVSDISGAIDDGKANGMAYKAAELTLAGVCKILKAGNYKPTPQWFEAALKEQSLHYAEVWRDKADLGTAVHAVLEGMCQLPPVIVDWRDFEAAQQPYVKAITDWYAENDPAVVGAELVVASRAWSFAGRFDLLYTQHGKRVLADLKTSRRIYPSHLIQLAGYSLALQECGYEPVDRMEVIWAKPDGSFSVIESKATHEDFLNLLHAYSSFNTNKDHLEKAA